VCACARVCVCLRIFTLSPPHLSPPECTCSFKIGEFSSWFPTRGKKRPGRKQPSLSAEFYSEGDKCSETLRRSAYLVHHCNSSAIRPSLIGAREVEVCIYVLDFESKEWCDVESSGAFVFPAAAKPAEEKDSLKADP